MYIDVRIKANQNQMLKQVVEKMVRENTNYIVKQYDEANKAIVSLQNQVKSLTMKVNRLEAQKAK